MVGQLVTRFVPRSTRGTLLSLLLLVLVPLLLLQGAIYVRSYQDRRAGELQSNLELARAASLAFNGYIRDVLRQELAIGMLLAQPPGMTPAQADELLTRNLQEYPSIRRFIWLNLQGTSVYSTDPQAIGIEYADRDYFQEIQRGREWVVSDLFQGRVDGKPAFVIARAERDSTGSLQGVLLATVDPAALGAVALPLRRSSDGAVSIIDRQSRVVYRAPEGDIPWEKRLLSNPQFAVNQALGGQEYAGSYASEVDGTRWIGGFVPIPSIGWVARASRPESEAIAPVLGDIGRNVVLFLVVTCGGFALALLASRRLTTAVGRLRSHALALGRGEFDRQVTVSGPSEMLDLARTYNQMAGEIRSHHETLHAQNEELQVQNEELETLSEELRTRHEELIRAQEALAKVAAIIESTDDAVIGKTLDGVITSWNNSAQRHYGYAAEEVIGKPISILVPEDRAGELLEILARLKHGQHVDHYETVRVRKDGSRVSVSVTVSPIKNPFGEIIGASTIARDISERKRAEEERERLVVSLRAAVADAERNRAQFEAVFQSIGDGLVLFDMAGNAILVNEAEARINDFESADDMMRNLAYFGEVYELAQTDGQPLPFDRWPAARVLRGEAFSDWELRGRRRDTGREWFFSFSGEPVRDDQGRQILAVVVTRDITERKQHEAERERLLAEVERRAVELQASNKELEAFSYSVSHDLRAPLRAIDGFSLAILEDYADKLDDEGKQYLQFVREGSQRMGQLIDDMLSLSRITRAEMRRQDVDLSGQAQEVAQQLKSSDPERQVEFVVAPGLQVHGDPRLLRAMLENLMGNAWKFTSKHPRARIEVGVTRQNGRATYFVRDDGAGFDVTYASKLFGAFQRLHSEGEFPGTGIGLATVQRIVRRHGGRIWAEGAVERGATFYFTL